MTTKKANTATATNKKEETTMSKKHDIYEAIDYVKSPAFKAEMMEAYWRTKGLAKSWSMFMGQDNVVIIKIFEDKNFLTPREMNSIMKNFCDFGDSKRRCTELFTAWQKGDYIAKHGHIDGRLVVIVQLLVD